MGEKTAKIIAKEYPTMDKLMNATYDELLNITDIGVILAKSIVSYFKEEENIKMVEELKNLGLNMNYKGKIVNKNEIFNDKKFVITGTIPFIQREKLKEVITSFGGKAIDSVSSKTDVLIKGDNPGSKYDKAKELNITIWDNDTLKEKLKEVGENYE